METTTSNHVNATSVNYQFIKSTFGKIEDFVKKNDYQFKDRNNFDNITESEFNSAWVNTSKKKRKKLAAYIWMIYNRPTLAGINKFFHFFMKTIMKSDVRVRVIKSDKEIAIQEKRKAYKEALAKMQAAYADYKQEKGDFYKIRLANNQAI